MSQATFKRRLPKRNFNEDLETISRDKLPRVFLVDFFEIRDVVKRDKGVDVQIELKGAKEYLGIEFLVQLKATNKSSKRPFHGITIRTSNIEYLLNHTQPSMYVLYVKETDKFYYEWAEEFANSLASKDSQWEQKLSHSLKFETELTQDQTQYIFQRVQRAAERNRRETDYVINNELDSIIDSIHKETHGKSLIDTFKYVFDTFSGLNVLPMHVIEMLPPFAKSQSSQCYYSDTTNTLFTGNEVLLDFFNTTTKKKNKIVLNQDLGTDRVKSKYKSEIMKAILNFFYINGIDHLSSISDKNVQSRICVHDLYVSGKCNCERCSFYRLDFKGAITKIEKAKPKTTYQYLRNVHTRLEMGDFKESYNQTKKLVVRFGKSGQFVAYFLCKHNLAKASGLYRWNYFESNRSEVLNYIARIDLDREIYLMQKKHHLSDEVVLVLKWISQSSYVNHLLRELDQKQSEIGAVWRNDKLGGWTSADHSLSLFHLFNSVTRFIEFNLLPYDVIGGYAIILNKFFESFIMLQDLRSDHNKKFVGFTSEMLRVFLLQGSAEKIDGLISRYKIDRLKISHREKNAEENFLKMIDNYLKSLPAINEVSRISEGDLANHYLIRKQNDSLKCLLVLLSVIEIRRDRLNELLMSILEQFEKNEFVNTGTTSFLSCMVNRKVKLLDFKIIDRLYRLTLSNPRFDSHAIKMGMPNVIANHFSGHRLGQDTTKIVLDLIDGQMRHSDLELLINFWKIADDSTRGKIKSVLIGSLSQRFFIDDYYLAVMGEIIDYKSFWKNAIASVSITSPEKEIRQALGQGNELRNRRVNLIIDIAFKYHINLNEVKNVIPKDTYYQWLSNMGSFNYEQFNPIWVLEFYSEHYFKEFRKHSQLVAALKTAALSKNSEGLTNIYLKHFQDF